TPSRMDDPPGRRSLPTNPSKRHRIRKFSRALVRQSGTVSRPCRAARPRVSLCSARLHQAALSGTSAASTSAEKPRKSSADPSHSENFHPAIVIVNLELHSQRPFHENAYVIPASFTLPVGIGAKELVDAVGSGRDALPIGSIDPNVGKLL